MHAEKSGRFCSPNAALFHARFILPSLSFVETDAAHAVDIRTFPKDQQSWPQVGRAAFVAATWSQSQPVSWIIFPPGACLTRLRRRCFNAHNCASFAVPLFNRYPFDFRCLQFLLKHKCMTTYISALCLTRLHQCWHRIERRREPSIALRLSCHSRPQKTAAVAGPVVSRLYNLLSADVPAARVCCIVCRASQFSAHVPLVADTVNLRKRLRRILSAKTRDDVMQEARRKN